jgi:hypothetical protein
MSSTVSICIQKLAVSLKLLVSVSAEFLELSEGSMHELRHVS